MIYTALMRPGDLDQVTALEHASFSQEPWSRDAFEKELSNPCARYVLLKEDDRVLAFAGVWLVLDEAQITNIAVLPEERGKGYGEQVTRALLQLCADSGMAYATLECRRSNAVAQNLYHKVGFIDVGYRKRFYGGVEDALIMLNQHLPEAHPENDPFLITQEEDAGETT